LKSTPELVREFAQLAGTRGWKFATLTSFCAANDISPLEMRGLWPKGIRSVAWQLNERADSAMLDRSGVLGTATLSELILTRFADNESLKTSVRNLALSDALHPLDTLARTARTAGNMWRCLRRPGFESGDPGWIRVWGLTFMYSACVVVWLLDQSKSQRAVRAAIDLGVRALGAK
jgi:hypothetical protein